MWPNTSSSEWQHPSYLNYYSRCPFAQTIPAPPPPITAPPVPFNLWPSENTSVLQDLPLHSLRSDRVSSQPFVQMTRGRRSAEESSNHEVPSPPVRRRRFTSPERSRPDRSRSRHHDCPRYPQHSRNGSSSRRLNCHHEGPSQVPARWSAHPLGAQRRDFGREDGNSRQGQEGGARAAVMGAGVAYAVGLGNARVRDHFQNHSNHSKGPHSSNHFPQAGRTTPRPPPHQHLCQKCGRSFASLTALRQHTGSSHRSFECCCGCVFCSEQAFAMHLEATGHQPEGGFVPFSDHLSHGASPISVGLDSHQERPLATWLSSHPFHRPRPAQVYTAEELFTPQEMADMDSQIYDSQRAGSDTGIQAAAAPSATGLGFRSNGAASQGVHRSGGEVWRPAVAHSTRCPLCRRQFASQRTLEHHLGDPSPGEQLRQHHCTHCNEGFCSSRALNAHTEESHPREGRAAESEGVESGRQDLLDRLEWSDFSLITEDASTEPESSVVIGFLDWRLLSLLRLHTLVGSRDTRHNMDFLMSESFALQTDEYRPSHTVSNLPEFKVKKQKETSWCSVCLDALEPGQMASRLSECSHIFHSRCVKDWLSRKQTCPVCRTAVAC